VKNSRTIHHIASTAAFQMLKIFLLFFCDIRPRQAEFSTPLPYSNQVSSFGYWDNIFQA